MKLIAAIGAALLIIGFVLFLNRLGHGGGFFASALAIAGAVLLLIALVSAIARVLRH